MNDPVRGEAQRRADEIAIFQVELARPDSEGVLRLDAARQQALREHHAALLASFAGRFDIDRDAQARQLSLGMRVASFPGALALAASVFFLFHQFRGNFDETAQVAILLGAALILPANADSKEFAAKARRAREQVKREEKLNSRLFAIDAGLDRAALRAKYPDRGRHLIVKATLRPRTVTRDKQTRIGGYLSALAVSRINVPHALRPTLEPALRSQRRTTDEPGARFEATIAFGQRLEPWIEAVSVPR